MRIKTIFAPLHMAEWFDSEVNRYLRMGWALKNTHTDTGKAGPLFLIAHLERWDGND